MTPEQEQVVLGLLPDLYAPRPFPHSSRQDVLRAFEESAGRELALQLLRQAVETKSDNDAKLALQVMWEFGYDARFLEVLRALARSPWLSHGHEDLVGVLEDLGGPTLVDDMVFYVWAGDEFRAYDGDSALARKALHVLERLGTPEAHAAIDEAARNPEHGDMAVDMQARRKG